MKLFRLFSKTQSAPAARERLQVLLAHERASPPAQIWSRSFETRFFASYPGTWTSTRTRSA